MNLLIMILTFQGFFCALHFKCIMCAPNPNSLSLRGPHHDELIRHNQYLSERIKKIFRSDLGKRASGFNELRDSQTLTSPRIKIIDTLRDHGYGYGQSYSKRFENNTQDPGLIWSP